MGFILNRSIYVSLITYAGVVVGYLNVLWLYPLVLDLKQIGLLRTLQDGAMLLVPFAHMGAGQGLLRYFPHGSTQADKQQIVSLSLLWSLFSFLFFLLLFWLLQDWIYLAYQDNAQALIDFLPVVILLVFILNLQAVLEPLARSLLKFRIVAFAKEVLLRLLSALLVVSYFFGLISFTQTVWGLVVVYALVTLFIAVYLARLGWVSFHIRYSDGIKLLIFPFMRYGLVTLLSSASSLLVMKTDSLMISQMISLEANAIYTTVFFMAVVIELPRRILSQISSPLLSQAFEQHNMTMAQKIYQKSSLNLLLIGGLLLVGIICNMPRLFEIMPKGDSFQAGAWVVVLVGIGKLVDGAAGFNGELLMLSKYYKLNLYFTLLMAATNVLLNYLFIPVYGIEGAALGSCLSLVFFNLIKFLYIRKKLGLQPFNVKTAILSGILLFSFVIGWYMPVIGHPIADMAVRSVLITLLVGAGTLIFHVSEEATSLYARALQLLKQGRF